MDSNRICHENHIITSIARIRASQRHGGIYRKGKNAFYDPGCELSFMWVPPDPISFVTHKKYIDELKRA